VFLGVLFIILSIFFGVAVSTLLKMSLTVDERLCFAVFVGTSMSTILVYLLSYWQKRLDSLSISVGMALIAIASILILKLKRISGVRPIGRKISLEVIVVALFGTVAFLLLNLRCVLRDELNSVYSSLFIWGDYAFHTSVISSFVYRSNLPPHHPAMINTPMEYPFLMDFLSSILMKTGFNLRSSIVIPNVLLQVSMLCLVAIFAIRVVKRKYAGVLSALLFFFAGNLGLIYAISDIAGCGGFANWIAGLPKDYSGSGVSSVPPIYFGNPVVVMLLPQRSSILGMGLALIVYVLILHALHNEGSKRELVLAGILAGLLASIHPHSFIAVLIVSFFLMIGTRRDIRSFAYLFVPVATLALPKVLAVQAQVGQGFMGFAIGWLSENAVMIRSLDWTTPMRSFFSVFESVSLLTKFWLLNTGFILLPFIYGFLKSDTATRRFYLPCLTLFLIGNFVRFQPWDWDNYKILLHWYIPTLMIASSGIIQGGGFPFKHLIRTLRARKLPSLNKTHLKAVLGAVAVATMLFLSMITGFLSHLRMLQESYLMWSEADIAFAEWIRDNTPSESVFLTSTDHLHPAVSLAGRKIILGFEGWLWSHGIDWNHVQEVKRDSIEMFRGDYTLMKKYGVDFISITHYERRFSANEKFKINIEFLDESGNFEKVFDRTLNGNSYAIFKVL